VPRGEAGDPISVATQLFSALGENVTVSGSTFRQALAACAVPVVGPLSDVVSKIEEVAKLGSRVTLTNVQEIQSVLNGKRFRLKAAVTFNVVEEDSLPALTNISGLTVHEVIWIDIRGIQVKQNDGNKIVRVVTSEGTKDIVLGGVIPHTRSVWEQMSRNVIMEPTNRSSEISHGKSLG
jgi:hypothetical protein